MADPLEIQVYYEGNDDRAVLEALRKADLLPENLTIARQAGEKGGKEQMVSDLAVLVASPAARSAIALRDFDDLKTGDVAQWFAKTLEQESGKHEFRVEIRTQPTTNARVTVCEVAGGEHTGHAAVVCVGLPGESELTKKWGVEEFAMDDYVLRLVCDQGIYEAVSELEGVRYELAFSKLAKTQKLLTENSIPVVQAKRLLHLLRGITGFRASPAVFASRLMEEGLRTIGKEKLADLFEPLLGDIRTATEALSPG